MTELFDYVDHHQGAIAAVTGCAALAVAAYACRGMIPALAKAESAAASGERVGFMSLGGSEHADELARYLDSVSHPLIAGEPEDAGFARAFAMAVRHDANLSRMARVDSVQYTGPLSPRVERIMQAAARRGVGLQGDGVAIDKT